MNPMSRALVLAASSAAALLAATPAHAESVVRTGEVNVLTGDHDLLEDVMEHISMPRGTGHAMTHQLYDSSGAVVPE
jgi:hypothetical protein